MKIAPEKYLSFLHDRSQQLYHQLKRSVSQSEFDQSSLISLAKCFYCSAHYLEQDPQKQEVDFLREKGVSFNPRPARLCHILGKDLQCNDAFVLQILLLSCVGSEKFAYLVDFSFEKELLDGYNSVISAVSVCNGDPTYFSTLLLDEKLGDLSLLVVLCHSLDRFRHFHQAAESFQSEHRLAFLSLANRLLEQIDAICNKNDRNHNGYNFTQLSSLIAGFVSRNTG
jgi:hypothetical protein